MSDQFVGTGQASPPTAPIIAAAEGGDQMVAAGSFTPHSHRLLNEAQRLLGEKQYSLSILVSVIACEVATARIFDGLYKANRVDHLANPIDILLRSSNLSDHRTLKFYHALANDDPIQKQDFWEPYRKAVNRRNEVAHAGKEFEEKDAVAALDAATEFVSYLRT